MMNLSCARAKRGRQQFIVYPCKAWPPAKYRVAARIAAAGNLSCSRVKRGRGQFIVNPGVNISPNLGNFSPMIISGPINSSRKTTRKFWLISLFVSIIQRWYTDLIILDERASIARRRFYLFVILAGKFQGKDLQNYSMLQTWFYYY